MKKLLKKLIFAKEEPEAEVITYTIIKPKGYKHIMVDERDKHFNDLRKQVGGVG